MGETAIGLINLVVEVTGDRDNRLHKLIKLMTTEYPDTGITYDWKYEELAPAVRRGFKKPSINEIKRLCEILIRDNMVEVLSEGSVHLTHTNLANARQAYYGEKYKEERYFWSLPLMGTTIFAALATISSGLLGYIWYDQRNAIHALEAELKISQKLLKKDSLLHAMEKKELKVDKGDPVKLKK